MRQPHEVWKEFLELQIEQNAVALEVVHKRQLLQGWYDSMERAKHNRDLHNRFWDADFALKCQKKYEGEECKAHEKFETNQKRLADLKDELVAILAAAEPKPGGLVMG